MKDHAKRAHSEIGASSASRWMKCPASVGLSRGIEQESSEYAEEGTALHEAVDYCIENGIWDAWEVEGRIFNENGTIPVMIREDHVQPIQYCLDVAKRYLDSGYECFVEEKFELPHIHEELYGSNDFCALGKNEETNKDELVVVDWKFGRGLKVLAERNPQLIIYALGAYEGYKDSYEFTKVRLVIVQPRFEGNEYDEWEITVDELLAYIDPIKSDIDDVYSEKPAIVAGDHCRFCLAKPNCPELKRVTEEVIDATFEAVPIEYEAEKPSLPEVDTLTNEQITKILHYSKTIEDWLKAVNSHAYNMLEKGEKIPGYKLVKARSNRKVRDEEELIQAFGETFGDQLYQTKLQTLGKLEKLIGKKELAPFLEKPDKGNQMAPESDKREEVVPVIEQMFDDADEEDFDNMEF